MGKSKRKRAENTDAASKKTPNDFSESNIATDIDNIKEIADDDATFVAAGIYIGY